MKQKKILRCGVILFYNCYIFHFLIASMNGVRLGYPLGWLYQLKSVINQAITVLTTRAGTRRGVQLLISHSVKGEQQPGLSQPHNENYSVINYIILEKIEKGD